MTLTQNKFLVENTPLEDHRRSFGLLVKREDLSCPPPGPPFSKTRGVLAHVQARYAEGTRLFGVLDTSHSQAGHAVAAACRYVGAKCVNYYPVYKRELLTTGDPGVLVAPLRSPQARAKELGATLAPLQAGRSAVLYHTARRQTEEAGGYMMPNALKLPETITETAKEVVRTVEHADRETYHQLRGLPWIVAASSATIAAGVIRGLEQMFGTAGPPVIVHMGYARSHEKVLAYITSIVGHLPNNLVLVEEHYAYADEARPGPTPPWPCNPYYDLKAFRWWVREGREKLNSNAVLWNIG